MSPVVLEAYRSGDIDLEVAQAFAISDDHAAQERVLAELDGWQRSASCIRRHLTEGEIPATDKRVRFVGLEAYEAAGGVVRRDLFDDEASGTVIDHALLNRLAAEKLATLAGEIRAEGWDWVDVYVDFDSSVLTNFRRVQPVRVELSEDQQARSAALAEEYDQLADSAEADDGDESVLARIGEIEGELEALEEAQSMWTPETLAIAGAIVTLAWDGSLDIIRGLIRRGDEPEVVSSDEEPPRKGTGIPAALIEALTTEKTSIVSCALSTNPAVALAAVVHALTLQTFYSFGREQSCLTIALRDIPFAGYDDAMNHDWAARVPSALEIDPHRDFRAVVVP